MIIAIDASRACGELKTGVEYYSLALLQNLQKIEAPEQFILFAPQAPPKELLPLPPNWTWQIIAPGRLWTQVKLAKALKRTRHDILFVPSHVLPAYYKGVGVITIHDVGYTERPDLYEQSDTFYQKWANTRSVKNSRGIVTPSTQSKESLVKWRHIAPQSVKMIPHGYRAELFRPHIDELLPHNVRKPYIYFVGRIEKKKNIKNMLEAYKYLRNERKIEHKLVLAGKNGFGSDEIKRYYQELPLEIRKDIQFLGYVNDADNAVLMRNADIFFFPSWIEGFGFPVLEAMASGVPVICSNIPSLKEITGNAAILVDPDKPFSMAAALSKLINNLKLKELMLKTGLHQSRKYSWRKCTEETLDYLRLISLREGKR